MEDIKHSGINNKITVAQYIKERFPEKKLSNEEKISNEISRILSNHKLPEWITNVESKQ